MSQNTNAHSYEYAPNAGYDDYPHHRHPYHAHPSPGPSPSPRPSNSPYLDIDDKSGAPLSPASSTAALQPDFAYGRDGGGYAGPSSRGGGEATSYPAYAHYEIPDHSPSMASATRTVSRDSRVSRDPNDLKEGEIPDGWTKEDEEAEKAFLKAGLFNWRELSNWRFWIRLEWWCELLS